MKPVFQPDLFDTPNPVPVSRELLAPRHLHPGAVAEYPRRRLDPVPGARLGQPCALSARARTTSWCRCPTGMTWRNTLVGLPEDVMRIAGNEVLQRPERRAADPVRQRRLALVGRLGGLRRRQREGDDAARRAPRSAWIERPPARRRQWHRGHRLQRELVAGAQRDAHAVRARAQSPLRRAAGATTATGTTSASTRLRG